MKKIPVPSSRSLIVGTWLVAIAVLVLIVWMLATIGRLSTDTVQTREDLASTKSDAAKVFTSLADSNAAQDAALEEANRRLREAGKAPVPTPPIPASATRGIPGVPGIPGDRGLPGINGASGIPGARGPAGRNGGDGVDGSTGPAGSDGSAGANGEPGSPGKDGANGSDGARGPQGDQGPAGDPGPAGPAGPNGAQGVQGIPGVVAVDTSPSCSDLAPNMAISLTYDAATQTITLVCT